MWQCLRSQSSRLYLLTVVILQPYLFISPRVNGSNARGSFFVVGLFVCFFFPIERSICPSITQSFWPASDKFMNLISKWDLDDCGRGQSSSFSVSGGQLTNGVNCEALWSVESNHLACNLLATYIASFMPSLMKLIVFSKQHFRRLKFVQSLLCFFLISI